jgi:hypothetical protein
MLGSWKYITKKSFTPLSLTVHEISGYQAEKQGFYAGKDFTTIVHAAELGLVLFKK